jgi:hypothetical protein
MQYHDIELHNVAELIEGSIRDLVGPDAQNLAGGDPAPARWVTRVPDALRRTLNPSARVKALEATGCELRFNQKSETARVVLASLDVPSVAEVYFGSFLVSWHVIGTQPAPIALPRPGGNPMLARLTREKELPFDAMLTRVHLPWRPAVKLIDVDGAFEPPRPGQTPRRTMLCYGSSITHGNCSVRHRGDAGHGPAQSRVRRRRPPGTGYGRAYRGADGLGPGDSGAGYQSDRLDRRR